MTSERHSFLGVMAPGRLIRYRRIMQNMTQSECAALLGISAAQLSRIERGQAPLPVDVARRLELWWDRSTRKKNLVSDFTAHVVHSEMGPFASPE